MVKREEEIQLEKIVFIQQGGITAQFAILFPVQ
jgi:hypothetical protein